MKCHHLNPSMPYLAAHADAARRLKLGQRQRQCPTCRRWLWPTSFFSKSLPRATKYGNVRLERNFAALPLICICMGLRVDY
jgi:hypothetical protein